MLPRTMVTAANDTEARDNGGPRLWDLDLSSDGFRCFTFAAGAQGASCH